MIERHLASIIPHGTANNLLMVCFMYDKSKNTFSIPKGEYSERILAPNVAAKYIILSETNLVGENIKFIDRNFYENATERFWKTYFSAWVQLFNERKLRLPKFRDEDGPTPTLFPMDMLPINQIEDRKERKFFVDLILTLLDDGIEKRVHKNNNYLDFLFRNTFFRERGVETIGDTPMSMESRQSTEASRGYFKKAYEKKLELELSTLN